jgi:type VI secretion system secreted protein Hcp
MRGVLMMTVTAAALLLGAGAASAAIDAYLQIDGVKGESRDVPGAIEVSSFSWGASRGMSSPTGGSADRESSAPSVSEIVIRREVDKASPMLMKCATTGCHYPSVMLYVRKAGGGSLSTYKLTDVTVSHYSHSGGSEQPTESISLNFAKIEMQTASVGGPMASHSTLPPPGPGAH